MSGELPNLDNLAEGVFISIIDPPGLFIVLLLLSSANPSNLPSNNGVCILKLTQESASKVDFSKFLGSKHGDGITGDFIYLFNLFMSNLIASDLYLIKKIKIMNSILCMIYV